MIGLKHCKITPMPSLQRVSPVLILAIVGLSSCSQGINATTDLPADSPTSISHAQGPLDGKVFVVEQGKRGEDAAPLQQELVFQAGRFHSSGYKKYGFQDSTYLSEVQGSATLFETELTSHGAGKIVWTGTVSGNEIGGTYTWYKPPLMGLFNQNPVQYWFRGKLKQ
jgi:hypothetical protein